jgi:hypothetical protein
LSLRTWDTYSGANGIYIIWPLDGARVVGISVGLGV